MTKGFRANQLSYDVMHIVLCGWVWTGSVMWKTTMRQHLPPESHWAGAAIPVLWSKAHLHPV